MLDPERKGYFYRIFVSKFRKREVNEEWPEDWHYSSDNVTDDSYKRKSRTGKTGLESFAESISNLPYISSFRIFRKKYTIPSVDSDEFGSLQTSFLNDDEMARLELLIRKKMRESRKIEKILEFH